jgi:hypothetical protein
MPAPQRILLGCAIRRWAKTKNRFYWRWEMERKSALNRLRVKQFV